jgi:endoglucanase
VGTLLLAWEHFPTGLVRLELAEIPEHGGIIPDYLDEVKYELDWLLSMQRADGAVHDKLTEAEFGGFVMPERDGKRRALAPISGEATASFAAVMAQAARIYEQYDADFAQGCLGAAERANTFLSDNPGPIPFSAEGFGTGRYNSPDGDERLWAAVELWRSTGESRHLSAFEALSAEFAIKERWDWPDVQVLAFASYLSSNAAERDPSTLETLRTAFTDSARALVQTSTQHGYGRAIGPHYIWGSNGIAIRAVINLATAHLLEPDSAFEQAAFQQLDHLFGVNAYGRSQVTGVGFLPPLYPHHRPSGTDGVTAPWPGLLVGGANPAPTDEVAPATIHPALSWAVVQASYWSNEIAINWNAPLVYALAWAASGG